MAPSSATVAALELGFRLRDAREEVGLSGIKAAQTLGISQNFLSEVEHGKRRLTEDKLAEAADLYSIHKQELSELRALRDQSDERGWWIRYSGLFPPDMLRYFGYEWGAESIRSHESLLIPGLLQTEAYARAVIDGDKPNIRASDTDQRVAARLKRQRRITDADDPVKFTVVLSEGALKQQVGGPKVLAEQLQHLIDLIEAHPETLEVLVVPFTADAHGALGASTFHLLTFPSPQLPDLAWQETVTTAGLIESSTRVRQFSLTWADCVRHAADRTGSLDVIFRDLKALT
ncbi:helix-turn-helix domain-containing protein [Saccharopolyspora pogona]|uniref:helix-turn-helix domain-containing protein n=1 Tax=Saccharopolyspora pogona TaxID=333966 RepID=UPI001683F610|nr:helix-turn-helix transcriptional regulator [Saccharopolyspora pogona]